MGLAVSVGPLSEALEYDQEYADELKEELAVLNTLLLANGLQAHNEPEALAVSDARDALQSFPYSFLHYLRRANVYHRGGKGAEFTPWEAGSPTQDPMLADDDDFFSHLNSHSDCEGYYVPQAFDEVLTDNTETIRGGFVGSSQMLLAELVSLAPLIGITLEPNGGLLDQEAARINQNVEDEGPLWIEQTVWLTMYEAARLSILNKALISFG